MLTTNPARRPARDRYIDGALAAYTVGVDRTRRTLFQRGLLSILAASARVLALPAPGARIVEIATGARGTVGYRDYSTHAKGPYALVAFDQRGQPSSVWHNAFHRIGGCYGMTGAEIAAVSS